MKMLAYIRTIRIYVLILGGLCLSYGVYQKYWYSDLIGEAVEAIEANRLDQQYLDKAKESFFAQKDLYLIQHGSEGLSFKQSQEGKRVFLRCHS